MTQLDPALDASLRQPVALIFGAVAINLLGHQLRLLDGAASFAFGGDTYVGRDPLFGALAEMQSLTDGMGSEAPRLSVSLYPSDDAAASTLAAAEMQGCAVRVYFGSVDPQTGQVIGTHLLFLGELDVPTLSMDDKGRKLDYEVASFFERFFEDDEGARLSPGFHQSIWPGEKGFDYLTGVPQGVYWGVEAPPRGVVGAGAGASGGAGGSARNGRPVSV